MDKAVQSRRGRPAAAVRGWPLWQLPVVGRWYVITVPAVAAAAAVPAAASLSFQPRQLVIFGVLLFCGLGSVEASKQIQYTTGGIVRDLLTVWILPVAILLPPFYAIVAPWPLLVLTQLRVHRGIVHRRVFSAAAIGLAYSAASLAFRSLPASANGSSPGVAGHAVLWCLAVAACDALAWAINNLLIATAILAADPTARIRELFTWEALYGDGIQWAVAVIVTLVAAISPVLLVFAWPTVLLQRRFMMHAQLTARARVDPKTGLLHAQAWERDAATAIARADRAGAPLAVAIADLDFFKAVNDTYGHLAGDEALCAISRRFTGALRPGDLAGRFGGDEFALLFPGAAAADAGRIAERLRLSVAQSPVTVGSGERRVRIDVTASIGVAALDGADRTVTDLLAAADSALYRAKEGGRNCTYVVTSTSAPAKVTASPADTDLPFDRGTG
jgi:diguanylate cyclase (GGDEF)-like protein